MKLCKPSDTDDVESHLKMFERLMQAHDTAEARWSIKLAPYLTGKTQQDYTALEADEGGQYVRLKAAILVRYGINEEHYRVHFRQTKKEKEEIHREFSICLQDLVDKWMADCGGDAAKIKDKIVTEQLINTLYPARFESTFANGSQAIVKKWENLPTIISKPEEESRVMLWRRTATRRKDVTYVQKDGAFQEGLSKSEE